MIEPQAAATVMIARDTPTGIEVFMLRRSSRSAFMPDVFVFPGGRSEASDRGAPALERLAGNPQQTTPALVFAAARETFEECGLLFATDVIAPAALAAARERILAGTLDFVAMLAELDTRVDASALRYFSRWITPPNENRRFDTHFFVARAPVGQQASACAAETHDGLWIAPRLALERSAAGLFALIFPTIKHLERLTAFDRTQALLDYAASKLIAAVMPAFDAERGLMIPAPLEGVW